MTVMSDIIALDIPFPSCYCIGGSASAAAERSGSGDCGGGRCGRVLCGAGCVGCVGVGRCGAGVYDGQTIQFFFTELSGRRARFRDRRILFVLTELAVERDSETADRLTTDRRILFVLTELSGRRAIFGGVQVRACVEDFGSICSGSDRFVVNESDRFVVDRYDL